MFSKQFIPTSFSPRIPRFWPKMILRNKIEYFYLYFKQQKITLATDQNLLLPIKGRENVCLKV